MMSGRFRVNVMIPASSAANKILSSMHSILYENVSAVDAIKNLMSLAQGEDVEFVMQ